MKKLIFYFLFSLLLALSSCEFALAQNSLHRTCAGTTNPRQAKVEIDSTGNILLTNCAGRKVLVNGSEIGAGGGLAPGIEGTPRTAVSLALGADLGAKINAAQSALIAANGVSCGNVIIDDNSIITTQIIVENSCTLEFANKTYNFQVADSAILLKSNSKIKGQGKGITRLLENHIQRSVYLNATGVNYSQVYSTIRSWGIRAYPFSGIDSNITLEDFTIDGSTAINPLYEATVGTISIGNVKGIHIERIELTGTNSIGLNIGGTNFEADNTNNFASKITIKNCDFTATESASLNVLNGEDGEISGNKIFRPSKIVTRFSGDGSGGSPYVQNNLTYTVADAMDFETNDQYSHLRHLDIHDNIINFVGSVGAQASALGVGIHIQNAYNSRYVGKVNAVNNQVIGRNTQAYVDANSNGIRDANEPFITLDYMSRGISYDSMQDSTIALNYVFGGSQEGIYAGFSRRLKISTNGLIVAGGGIASIHLVNSSGCDVENNFSNRFISSGDYSVTRDGLESWGSYNGSIVEANQAFNFNPATQLYDIPVDPKFFSDYNRFINNSNLGLAGSLVGVHSEYIYLNGQGSGAGVLTDAGNYKTLTAGSGVTITTSAGALTINAAGGGASVARSVIVATATAVLADTDNAIYRESVEGEAGKFILPSNASNPGKTLTFVLASGTGATEIIYIPAGSDVVWHNGSSQLSWFGGTNCKITLTAKGTTMRLVNQGLNWTMEGFPNGLYTYDCLP